MSRIILLSVVATVLLSIFTDALGQDQTSTMTRYGIISSNEDNQLTFKGKLTTPVLQGNTALAYGIKAIRYGQNDLVIVEDDGGTSCPAMFSVVEINARGVAGIYGEFGTCSDLIKVHPLSNGELFMTMPDYESYEAQGRHHGRKRTTTSTYVFSGGHIKENGRLIKNELPTY